MAVPTYNCTWEQGTDFTLKLIYKEGPAGSEVPVDLTPAGTEVRMDIAQDGARLYTFNSASITDLDGTAGPGNTGDTTLEATLGADGSINIEVPRSLTLPGGTLAASLNTKPTFDYDVILRRNGKQMKILSGTITVTKSVTLWE